MTGCLALDDMEVDLGGRTRAGSNGSADVSARGCARPPVRVVESAAAVLHREAACPAWPGVENPHLPPGASSSGTRAPRAGGARGRACLGGIGRVAQATESTSRSSKADGARRAESAACHAMLRLPRALPFFLVHTRHPPRPPWHVQTLSESLGSTALTLWQQRPIMLSGHERALTRQSSLRLSHLHRGTRHPRQLWGVVRSLLELV